MSDYDKQIAEIYREMELELIRSMKRNLGLHLAEEKEAGVKYPQWQAIKFKEMKRYERQNLNIIRRSTARIPKDVSAHMQDEFRQGSSHEIKKYKKVNRALGISSEPVKDSFFRTDARKVTSMIDDVNNSLRTANTAVFRMTNDAYREVVFKYSMFVSNGVYTEKQAYDAAVKSFLERGINCIEYKDGRRVNIADYAQMAVRTANQRAYMTGQGEFRKKLGRTLIRISQHSTSCELCRPFERQVLIDDVFSGGTQADGDYMLLSEAMAKGLYHPRCRHGSATYFPELDDKIEEKPIKDNSAAKAEKAHAENMVQKYKRLSEGSLCPENVARYQAKLEEWTEKAKNISKEVENIESNDIIQKANEIISESKNLYADLTMSVTDDQLTAEDEAVIKRYISSDSYVINEKLRNQEILTKDEREFVRKLDIALGKLPNYEGIVYRSVDSSGIPDLAEFWHYHAKNECITYHGYTSTSLSVYDPEMDIQFVIESIRGKDMSNINKYEAEILFKRESIFIVDDIKGNTIYLKEV